MSLVEGFLFGFLLSLMIGPIFFVLLQSSIERGRIAGFSVALGAALSDFMILTLYLFGLMTLALNDSYSKVLGYLGVAILVFSGFSLINRPKDYFSSSTQGVKEKSPGQLFIKGFLINSLNPFVFIFWMGVVAFLTKRYATNSADIFTFIAGVFSAILITDILKVFLSTKVRPHLKTANLRVMSMLTGVVLIGYGILLFYKML